MAERRLEDEFGGKGEWQMKVPQSLYNDWGFCPGCPAHPHTKLAPHGHIPDSGPQTEAANP